MHFQSAFYIIFRFVVCLLMYINTYYYDYIIIFVLIEFYNYHNSYFLAIA